MVLVTGTALTTVRGCVLTRRVNIAVTTPLTVIIKIVFAGRNGNDVESRATKSEKGTDMVVYRYFVYYKYLGLSGERHGVFDLPEKLTCQKSIDHLAEFLKQERCKKWMPGLYAQRGFSVLICNFIYLGEVEVGE